jgi:hypothetical protein
MNTAWRFHAVLLISVATLLAAPGSAVADGTNP